MKKIAIIIGAIFVSFINNFSSQENVLLGILVILGFVLIEKFGEVKQKEEFIPFTVNIFPKWWDLLLKDYYGADEEMMSRIRKIMESESNEYNVLKNGITLTFLKPNLIYFNGRNIFSPEVDFREKIPALERKSKGKDDFLFHYVPEFFIKANIDGYDLGVTTPESFKKVIMVGDDNELVNVATIPYNEFFEFYGNKVITDKDIEIRDKQLVSKGWKSINENVEDIIVDFPNHIEHKYFDVYYKQV